MFKQTITRYMAVMAFIGGVFLGIPTYAEPQITISRQGQVLDTNSQAYKDMLQAFLPAVQVWHEYYGDNPRCSYPVFEARVDYYRYPAIKPGWQAAFFVEMKQDSQNGKLPDRVGYSVFTTYYGALDKRQINTPIEPDTLRYFPGMFLHYFDRLNYVPYPGDVDEGFMHLTAIGNNTWKFAWNDFNAAVLKFRFWPDTDQMQDYIEIEVRESAYTVNRQTGSERCPINVNRLANL